MTFQPCRPATIKLLPYERAFVFLEKVITFKITYLPTPLIKLSNMIFRAIKQPYSTYLMIERFKINS